MDQTADTTELVPPSDGSSPPYTISSGVLAETGETPGQLFAIYEGDNDGGRPKYLLTYDGVSGKKR